jgi:hypothetical protein
MKRKPVTITIHITDEGFYFCPRRNQIMELIICQARKGRKRRGCCGCKVPQQVKGRNPCGKFMQD